MSISDWFCNDHKHTFLVNGACPACTKIGYMNRNHYRFRKLVLRLRQTFYTRLASK